MTVLEALPLSPPLRRRIGECISLTRFDRPIGWLLLLWPILWALWIAARGVPSAKLLTIFVAGTILTRSAGCIVNDLADRDFDPQVQRTRLRPLAARRISPYEALALFVARYGRDAVADTWASIIDAENLGVHEDSLKPFVRHFCAPAPVHSHSAHEAPRTTMTQPNVYWTLNTPFATIIGLYTNVPEGLQPGKFEAFRKISYRQR